MSFYNIESSSFAILPLTKIASANIVRNLWNEEFRDEFNDILKFDSNEYHYDPLGNVLTLFREELTLKLYEFIEINELPLIFKTVFRKSVFSLYKTYQQMMWLVNRCQVLEIHLNETCDNYIDRYFTTYEDFNEVICVKQFLRNPSIDLFKRFTLACVYCFESETATLWEECINSPLNLIEFEIVHSLVSLRMWTLEDSLPDFEQNNFLRVNFWKDFLMLSVKDDFTYATYFFWNKLSEEEKLNFINDDAYFELLDNVGFCGHKITLFLYLQLSNDRKKDLLNWMVDDKIRVWLNLSFYWHMEDIRAELISCLINKYDEIFINIYVVIAHRIRKCKLPNDIKIFEVLWNMLHSQSIPSVEKVTILVIEGFVQEKSFINLGTIIKSLRFVKKHYLLTVSHGQDCIYRLCKEKEFNLLQEFYSFFLFKLDPITQSISLEDGASTLLRQYIDSSQFLNFSQDFSEATVQKVKNIIESFQMILELLDQLCHNVCQEVISL